MTTTLWSVRRTGSYGYISHFSESDLAMMSALLGPEEIHRRQVSAAIGPAVMETLLDGRGYMVKTTTTGPDQSEAGRTVYSSIVEILLLDAREAEIGDMVWRGEMQPGASARPNLRYRDLSQTTWSMAKRGVWLRES